MRPINMQRKWLDGKELFYLMYERMGRGSSTKKLAGYMAQQGIYNIDTGKPFTPGAIYLSMWRWGLRNIDEAEAVFKRYIYLFGDNWDERKWKRRVVRQARAFLTKAQARQFFEDNPRFQE